MDELRGSCLVAWYGYEYRRDFCRPEVRSLGLRIIPQRQGQAGYDQVLGTIA